MRDPLGDNTIEPATRPQDVDDPRRWEAGELPATLRRWRATRQMSQRGLARHLGLNPGTVGRWERGAVPDPRRIDILADLLGAAPDDVRRAAGPDRIRRPQSTGGSNTTPLARARIELGLSQPDLARALAVSTPTISRWEGGERRPAAGYFIHLARVFGCEPAEIHAWFEDYPTSSRDGVGRLPGLRQLLSEQGITGQQFARATGASGALAQEWMNGRRGVPSALLPTLSTLLGRDVHPLIPELRRRRAPESGEAPSWLSMARRRRGLSRGDLASQVGVGRSAVGSWETGATQPPLPRARTLAAVLRVDFVTLADSMGLEVPPDPRGSIGELASLGQALTLLRAHSGLTAAQVGRCLGVTAGSVRRWERGATLPTQVRTRSAAALFALDAGELLQIREHDRRRRARSIQGAVTGGPTPRSTTRPRPELPVAWAS